MKCHFKVPIPGIERDSTVPETSLADELDRLGEMMASKRAFRALDSSPARPAPSLQTLRYLTFYAGAPPRLKRATGW